ncbi:hypothetical protein CIP107571_02059 [Corynebacterium diphtheriae]|nr:hypothetical protein CIP107571_02059 [Corynebacterium diphtheriae]
MGGHEQPYRELAAHRDIRRNISEALFFIRESGIGMVRKKIKNAMLATICYPLVTALIEQFFYVSPDLWMRLVHTYNAYPKAPNKGERF